MHNRQTEYGDLLVKRRPVEGNSAKLKECKRINRVLQKVRKAIVRESGATLDLEEKVALAFFRATEIREGSYKKGTKLKSEAYSLTVAESYQKAFAEYGFPPRIFFVFSLADHWCNDFEAWADDVLSGAGAVLPN